jgi:hypothetical protein
MASVCGWLTRGGAAKTALKQSLGLTASLEDYGKQSVNAARTAMPHMMPETPADRRMA